jgi:hypothetical protein
MRPRVAEEAGACRNSLPPMTRERTRWGEGGQTGPRKGPLSPVPVGTGCGPRSPVRAPPTDCEQSLCGFKTSAAVSGGLRTRLDTAQKGFDVLPANHQLLAMPFSRPVPAGHIPSRTRQQGETICPGSATACGRVEESCMVPATMGAVGRLAQMVRAAGLQPAGRGFESLSAHSVVEMTTWCWSEGNSR